MAFLCTLFVWALLYTMSDNEDVNGALCARSKIGWWKCSPCGLGTRCIFCNWCLAFCFSCGEAAARSESEYVPHPTYGDVDVPYKVSFSEMLEDIQVMLEEDEISDSDVVEIFKMTAEATREDSKLCNNSLEIEEISNLTESFYLELKHLIGSEEFNSVALDKTSQTNAMFESLPDSLLGRVETNSDVLSEVPPPDMGILLTGSNQSAGVSETA